MGLMIRYVYQLLLYGCSCWLKILKGNPHNWSGKKKFYHIAVPTAIAFLCPFGSSVYTPGVDQVSREFGVSREVALLPFVFYLLGLSFGPIVAGPVRVLSMISVSIDHDIYSNLEAVQWDIRAKSSLHHCSSWSCGFYSWRRILSEHSIFDSM